MLESSSDFPLMNLPTEFELPEEIAQLVFAGFGSLESMCWALP